MSLVDDAIPRRAIADSRRFTLLKCCAHCYKLTRSVAFLRGVAYDEDPDDPMLFGLWEASPYLPERITIFRLPLERAFPARADLVREVRVTVLHELAHSFGLDEERLDELGYG